MAIELNSLPEDTQLELYKTLQKKFGNKRDSGDMSKEDRLQATVDVLNKLNGMTMAQKRSVLKFALECVSSTQHRWWRYKEAKQPGGNQKRGRPKLNVPGQ